jgi:hypothetical protein
MSKRSIYFRGQADACRQHANQIMDAEMQGELQELADKFIVRAVEIETKAGTD